MDNYLVHELEVLGGILSDPRAVPIKVSYGLLKTITNNFSDENEIGRGGFGVVYQGGWQNWVVAVKKLSNAHDFSDNLFMEEIKCLRIANHKNVVRFLGYCAETQEEMMSYDGRHVMAGERNRLLCFEYVSNGNIRQYLQQECSQGYDLHAHYQMIKGICHGLRYLHDNKINHLDLKPENVMLDAQMEPKITDFGLSKLLDQGISTLVTEHLVGTLRYIAPEFIDRGERSLKSDIYALGIIIIELISGISLISLQNWDESLDMRRPGMQKLTEVARKCTQRDKGNRPTIHEVITDLDVLESIIPRSSVNQSVPTPTSLERTVVLLPSRSLAIAWVDNPQYWRWISHPDFRFGECAELLGVYYLKVSRQIAPKDLPAAATSYTAYLVYKLAGSTSAGLKDSVQTASTLHGQTVIRTSQVSLHPKAPRVDGVIYPGTTRPDGWLELKLGEFSNERAVTVQLLHEDPHNEMSGLIIKGMEVRSH